MIQIQSFTFNPFQENTYVLYDESLECVIVDPGCQSSQEQDDLGDFIISKNLKVKHLLNTHCHIDHVFGNQFVKDRYKVGLQIHKLDIPTLKSCKMVADMYQVKPFEESEADIFLDEGDQILFGNSTLDILFVPGHAPGHIAFVSHIQKFVVGGDVLFRLSIGRTDFPGCSHEELIKSIKTKFFPLGDDFTVYNGHGVDTTIGFERKNNPFLV